MSVLFTTDKNPNSFVFELYIPYISNCEIIATMDSCLSLQYPIALRNEKK